MGRAGPTRCIDAQACACATPGGSPSLPPFAFAAARGCTAQQLDECHQISRTLRSENAALKDQLLTAQAQNRDYADRAVDDSRRLATQDQVIERLEKSVQGYQDERAQLESAFQQLASSLGEPRALANSRPSAVSPAASANEKQPPQSSRRKAQDRGDEDQSGPAQ